MLKVLLASVGNPDFGEDPSRPGTALMPTAAAKLKISNDDLSLKVVETVKSLVEGNCATAKDVVIKKLERTDRTVKLKLDVGIGWVSSVKTYSGAYHPQGSVHCSNKTDMMQRMQKDCGAASEKPEVAADLAEFLKNDPTQKFADLEEGFKVADLPFTYHYIESCNTCGGRGLHLCGNCKGHGTVRCWSCYDGRQTCRRCGGGGSVYYNSQTRICGTCGGSGRAGRCYTCNGTQWANCITCGRSGEVQCQSCAATGLFTQVFTTRLTGTPKRQLVADEQAPVGFRNALKGVKLEHIPKLLADKISVDTSSASGAVHATLSCTVPHVAAEMACKHTDIVIDAIGNSAIIPQMPTFLDSLILDVLKKIENNPNHAEALDAAQKSRVTQLVLELVGSKEKLNAQGICSKFQNAISDYTITSVYNSLLKAYSSVGSSAIRRTWLVGGMTSSAIAVLAALYDLPRIVLNGAEWAAGDIPTIITWLIHTGVVGIPLLLTWLLAGDSGRQVVRNIVGNKANKLPSQGSLPKIVSVIVLALYVGAYHAPVDAYSLGLPYAERPGRGKAVSILDAVNRLSKFSPAAAEVLSGIIASNEGLTPSDKPKIKDRLNIPASEISSTGFLSDKGQQTALKLLGFYDGAIDGNFGPRSQAAFDSFRRAILDKKGNNRSELLRGAMSDEFRLYYPPSSNTMAHHFSNLVRSKLTKDDVWQIIEATNAAAKNFGKEVSWRNADGKRRGRVVAFDAGQIDGKSCVRVYQEVEFDGAVEQIGPQLACPNKYGNYAPTAY